MYCPFDKHIKRITQLIKYYSIVVYPIDGLNVQKKAIIVKWSIYMHTNCIYLFNFFLMFSNNRPLLEQLHLYTTHTWGWLVTDFILKLLSLNK